jgi:hypothetical protein
VNNEKFKIVQICPDVLFLCRPKYKLFRVEVLQGYRILYCQYLGFVRNFLEL